MPTEALGAREQEAKRARIGATNVRASETGLWTHDVARGLAMCTDAAAWERERGKGEKRGGRGKRGKGKGGVQKGKEEEAPGGAQAGAPWVAPSS